jgi:hypothetical protein
MILVHDAEFQIPHLAPECISEHDQLEDRHHQRHHDQRRTAAKPPDITF